MAASTASLLAKALPIAMQAVKTVRTLVPGIKQAMSSDSSKKTPLALSAVKKSPAQPAKSLSAQYKVIKNWQEAKNPENGFKQVGKLGRIAVMSKVEKNWQTAKKPESGFKQVGKLGKIGIMAKVEKNWERPAREGGFKRIGGKAQQDDMNIPMVELTSLGKSKPSHPPLLPPIEK